MAKYLLCVHINSNRKALCRIRLSSHRLFIERGIWTSIPRLDRNCTLCNEIEDEYHVMLICPRYTVLKRSILRNIILLNLMKKKMKILKNNKD